MTSWNRMYWLAVAGLLIFAAIRTHNLLALPLFLDESIHAEWSVEVWKGHPLFFGAHGRYLSIWWIALFYPFQAVPWLIRAATILLPLLGGAAIFTLTRRLYGSWAGIVALVFVTFAPMLFFFDRMALADTTLHAMMSLFALSLFRTMERKQFRRSDAIFSGGMLALCVLAKATALAIIPLPIVAAILLPRKWDWKTRINAILWVWGVALAIWLPLLLLMHRSGVDYLGVAITYHSEEASASFIERVLSNTRFLIDGIRIYFHDLPLVIGIIAIGGAIIISPRRGLTLAAAVSGITLAFIMFGNLSVSLRYWLAMIPLALVLVAGGLLVWSRWLMLLIERFIRPIHQQAAPVLVGLLVVVWWITLVIPFIQTAYTNPIDLPLPTKDRIEYIIYDSSGTTIPQMADYLVDAYHKANAPLMVSGAFAQCYALSIYIPANTELMIDCPDILSAERQGLWLDNHITQLTGENDTLYAVFEEPGHVQPDDLTQVDLEAVATFTRPGERFTLTIYRVHPR